MKISQNRVFMRLVWSHRRCFEPRLKLIILWNTCRNSVRISNMFVHTYLPEFYWSEKCVMFGWFQGSSLKASLNTFRSAQIFLAEVEFSHYFSAKVHHLIPYQKNGSYPKRSFSSKSLPFKMTTEIRYLARNHTFGNVLTVYRRCG